MKLTSRILKASIAAHPTAINSFNSNHLLYNQLRPTYPDSIVKAFTNSLNLHKSSLILELAAGTGKFTAKLLDLGFDTIKVVEPSLGMLESFRETFPSVDAIQGSSYEIPLPDASVDAIIVAQGFHWFSDSASLKEMKRVLRRDGKAGFIWNFDAESPGQNLATGFSDFEIVGEIKPTNDLPFDFAKKLFDHDLWNRKVVEFAYSYDVHVPQYRRGEWKKILLENDYFKPITKEIFQFYRLPINYDDVYKYWETRSYITHLGDVEKKAFKDQITEILLKNTDESQKSTVNGETYLEKYMGTHAVVIEPR